MKLFCIIGASGSGKSEIEKAIHEMGLAKKIVSVTTRSMREHEVEGVDYFYWTDEKFDEEVEKGNFIEHTSYNGWSYGGS